MARIADLLETGPTYSYEFFPPKNETQAVALEATIGELAATGPDFISITSGALGSIREATKGVAIAQNAQQVFPTMPHLTCGGQTQSEIASLTDEYVLNGIGNILALRGDSTDESDFRFAVELAEFIKDRHPEVSVGVAAHPEVHPDSASRAADRQHLAAKLEVADFAITQFFFEAGQYHKLVDELDALDCRKPIIPGVMLFSSVAGLTRMANMNNTHLPADLVEKAAAQTSPEDVAKLALEAAVQLVDELDVSRLPGIHVYTLNRSWPAIELKEHLA